MLMLKLRASATKLGPLEEDPSLGYSRVQAYVVA